jgi:peroxiredoxin
VKKLFLFVSQLFIGVTIMAQDGPKGLNVNDEAPAFSAKDQDGKTVSLKEQLKNGAVVLVFYRGQWCPYCNKQLKKLEDSLSLITGKGATLIAVTPEKPENISATIEKTKATYPILFDDGLTIMKSYDVAYAVDEKTIESYKKYGIDFNVVNGEKNGTNLPVPAIYVINKEGKIVFRHFDKNYTKRASVAEILAHL